MEARRRKFLDWAQVAHGWGFGQLSLVIIQILIDTKLVSQMMRLYSPEMPDRSDLILAT